MAIRIATSEPQKLLDSIRAAIDASKIRTWVYDSDGDFTHATEQWKNKAWLRPRINDGELALHILAPKGKGMAPETYAIYHGRFVESVLAHFDTDFTRAVASAMPEGGDNVAS